MNNKITPTVAQALAEKASKQINEALQKKQEKNIDSIQKSVKFKKLKELRDKANELSKQATSLELSLEKEYNISIYGDCSLAGNYNRISTNDLKNEFLIKGTFEGKEADVMIKEIVEQFTK
jgi:hypothetical protein